MNDDFSFSRWAVVFPVLSLTAFIVATVLIFTTDAGGASLNERRILYAMVAFLGLSALIQGNALFQIERRLKSVGSKATDDTNAEADDWEDEEVFEDQAADDADETDEAPESADESTDEEKPQSAKE